MAVFLNTTNLHITSTTSLSWVYLRIAFHRKRLHAAPYFAKWHGSVSLYNSPSHHLHNAFVLSLPSHCFSQQAPSRCFLFLSRDIAGLLSTTLPAHVCLEFAFALHFAPNDFAMRFFCREIWRDSSLQLKFTLPPSQVCLEFTFALLFHSKRLHAAFFLSRGMAVLPTTTNLHITSIVKRYGIVSHYI